MQSATAEKIGPDEALANAVVRRICRRQAKDFYFASAFLPAAKRDAAFAVLAFCRMVDDAMHATDPGDADPATPATGSTCGPGGITDQKLSLLRDRLDEIYAHRLELPAAEFRTDEQHILHAFERAADRYQIPKRYLLDYADGFRIYATISRYPTWPKLEKYCYHAGGVIWLSLNCVFGLTNSGATEQAAQLGTAMHFTRILRDLKTDWGAGGRLYLPLEDLMRFRYSERDLAAGVVNDNFRELMRFEIARARALFIQGADGLCWLAADGSRLTAATMAVISNGVLAAIARQGYDVFSRPLRLTTTAKLRRLPAAWRLARRAPGQKLPDVFG